MRKIMPSVSTTAAVVCFGYKIFHIDLKALLIFAVLDDGMTRMTSGLSEFLTQVIYFSFMCLCVLFCAGSWVLGAMDEFCL
jgi:hypothetical protein